MYALAGKVLASSRKWTRPSGSAPASLIGQRGWGLCTNFVDSNGCSKMTRSLAEHVPIRHFENSEILQPPANLPLDFYRKIVKNTHELIVLPVFGRFYRPNALACDGRIFAAVRAKGRLDALRICSWARGIRDSLGLWSRIQISRPKDAKAHLTLTSARGVVDRHAKTRGTGHAVAERVQFALGNARFRLNLHVVLSRQRMTTNRFLPGRIHVPA
jgi:hypothetical protein